MEQTEYTCKDCVLFNDEDFKFPYCMGKNLYTDVNPDDDACGDIIPLVYTCKDCFFFDNGVWECKEERFGRDVSEDDDACTDFEYKEIKVEL